MEVIGVVIEVLAAACVEIRFVVKDGIALDLCVVCLKWVVSRFSWEECCVVVLLLEFTVIDGMPPDSSCLFDCSLLGVGIVVVDDKHETLVVTLRIGDKLELLVPQIGFTFVMSLWTRLSSLVNWCWLK